MQCVEEDQQSMLEVISLMDTIFSKIHFNNMLFFLFFLTIHHTCRIIKRKTNAEEKEVNDRGNIYLTPLLCVISCLLCKYNLL